MLGFRLHKNSICVDNLFAGRRLWWEISSKYNVVSHWTLYRLVLFNLTQDILLFILQRFIYTSTIDFNFIYSKYKITRICFLSRSLYQNSNNCRYPILNVKETEAKKKHNIYDTKTEDKLPIQS